MIYLMPLAIVSASGTAIAVVKSPVALRRGGASPVPQPPQLYLNGMIH